MTTNPPEPVNPAVPVEPAPPVAEQIAAPVEPVKPVDAEPKGYAAYDLTYLKFVPGVHKTTAAARKAAKDAGVDKFEIREV